MMNMDSMTAAMELVVYFGDLAFTLCFAMLGAIKVEQHAWLQGKDHARAWTTLGGAMLTAVGGGTIRAMLLGVSPPVLTDHGYLACILGGLLVARWICRRPALYCWCTGSLGCWTDSLGLGIFVCIGAAAAHGLPWPSFVLEALFAVVGGALTACGGGAIADRLVLGKSNLSCVAPPARGLNYLGCAVAAGMVHQACFALGLPLLATVWTTIATALALRLWSEPDHMPNPQRTTTFGEGGQIAGLTDHRLSRAASPHEGTGTALAGPETSQDFEALCRLMDDGCPNVAPDPVSPNDSY